MNVTITSLNENNNDNKHMHIFHMKSMQLWLLWSGFETLNKQLMVNQKLHCIFVGALGIQLIMCIISPMVNIDDIVWIETSMEID